MGESKNIFAWVGQFLGIFSQVGQVGSLCSEKEKGSWQGRS